MEAKRCISLDIEQGTKLCNIKSLTEDSSRRIITSKTSLAHTRAIIMIKLARFVEISVPKSDCGPLSSEEALLLRFYKPHSQDKYWKMHTHCR